ncbi:MAG: DUF2784 domain-containing protein [Desulfovibrionales bacterium]|nr:DUF2784 domain-containing protein [Desulfovibrionales bacterium]
MYHYAATALLSIHLGFIIFVICGGFFALRWPRLAWVHVPAVVWASLVEAGNLACPLTLWEDALLRLAGQQGYHDDFIQHYLLACIYPEGLTRTVQWTLAAAILLVNAILYGILALRRMRGQ